MVTPRNHVAPGGTHADGLLHPVLKVTHYGSIWRGWRLRRAVPLETSRSFTTYVSLLPPQAFYHVYDDHVYDDRLPTGPRWDRLTLGVHDSGLFGVAPVDLGVRQIACGKGRSRRCWHSPKWLMPSQPRPCIRSAWLLASQRTGRSRERVYNRSEGQRSPRLGDAGVARERVRWKG
jgi:hypothetical protein